MNDPIFLKYSKLYAEHGFHLYMVGGTARDYLLGIPYSDYDFATDATPEQELSFLPQAEYTFAKYGCIKIRDPACPIDITTFREENRYADHRHPMDIRFIVDPKEDAKRRDFTINALYIDDKGQVLDYYDGQKDLHDGVIRFIGDPATRIKEDPLRILRAERFAAKLAFSIEPASQKAIAALRGLLSTLNPDKVKMELQKNDK